MQSSGKQFIEALAILVAMGGLHGCVEKFTPRITKYSDRLVVDGTLTDEGGIQVVTVSRTTNYSEADFVPEEGCTVTVLDDQGNKYPYTRKGAGTYEAQFSRGDLTYGRAYMLRVIDHAGDVFESGYQVLKPAPQIDSVTARYETKVTVENPVGVRGYQFYVNTSDSKGDTRYYRWTMEETWEYHVPFEVMFMWNGALHRFSFPDDRSTCWKTLKVPGIYTGTTREISDDVLKHVKLNFVNLSSDRLKWRYCLTVKAFSLSSEAYAFWSGLQQQTQESGGLYETQPYMIKGNISCVSSPEKLALGFFSVSGVTMRRVFVGPAPEPVGEMVCNLDDITPRNPIEDYPPSSYPVYLQGTLLPNGDYHLAAGERRCFDCLERGGTNIKPDFWQ